MGCPRDSDDSGTSSVPSEARRRPPSDRPPPRTAQYPTAQCGVLLYVKCQWGGDPCSYQLPAAVRIRLVSTVSHSFPSRLHFRRLSFMPPTAVTSFSTSMYMEGSELTWGREANRTFSAAVASDVGHGQREGHARVEQSCRPTAGWGWGGHRAGQGARGPNVQPPGQGKSQELVSTLSSVQWSRELVSQLKTSKPPDPTTSSHKGGCREGKQPAKRTRHRRTPARSGGHGSPDS